MAKKTSFDFVRENPGALAKAGTDAVKNVRDKEPGKDAGQRKLLQVNPAAHALAKKVAALDGVGMAEYVAGLIIADAAKRYPDLK